MMLIASEFLSFLLTLVLLTTCLLSHRPYCSRITQGTVSRSPWDNPPDAHKVSLSSLPKFPPSFYFVVWHMSPRPKVTNVTEYGNSTSFWVEYPSGLIDLSRTVHPQEGESQPPQLQSSQLDIAVNGERFIRINKATTAAVIIDMQKSVVDFRHPLGGR